MRVLVVDPNEAFATLLSEELKRLSYDVDMCLNGVAALRAAQEHAADLVILDMALANPDALTLGQQLRALDSTIRLMVIPLMGETLSPQASALGIQGVLPKPFFLPELPGLIEAALSASVGPAATASPVPAPLPSPTPPETRATADVAGLSSKAVTTNRTGVERLMTALVQDVGADTVLLTLDGKLLMSVGGLEATAVASIAQAVLRGWQASAEVARILGREQVRFEQSLGGGDYMLYALSVASNAIMAVAVRGSAPLGLLRHRARTAAEQITRLCQS